MHKAYWTIHEELDTIRAEISEQHSMEGLVEEYERVADALASIAEQHDLYEGAYLEFMSQYGRDVRRRFDQWNTSLFAPLVEKLHTAMRTMSVEMQERMPDIDAYEMPEGKEIPLSGDCLYDSGRGYVSQLAAYKHFAGKFSHLAEEENLEETA